MRRKIVMRFVGIVWSTAATSIAFLFAGLLFFGLLVPRKDKVAPNSHERHGSSIVPVQYLLISQMAEAAKKYSEIKVIEENPPVSPFFASYGMDTKDGLTVVTGSLPFVLNHGDVPTIDSEIVKNLMPSIGKFLDFRFTGISEVDSLSKRHYGIKEADRVYNLDFRWQAYLMDPFETYDLRVNR